MGEMDSQSYPPSLGERRIDEFTPLRVCNADTFKDADVKFMGNDKHCGRVSCATLMLSRGPVCAWCEWEWVLEHDDAALTAQVRALRKRLVGRQ